MASPAVQAAAAKIGRGRATIALELVGFDADLGAAMKYAFGNAFVCKVRERFLHNIMQICVHFTG